MATGTPVPGAATVDPADDTTLIFTPAANLATNTAYVFTALSGSQGVRDAFGGQLPQDLTINFTTGAM